ncbi:hypothetical protein BGZ73_001767 [Actinomortierella ambigua]|nr:hypothetical protein BGZ73_001767 [Actinomortierella ambigua]
MDAIAAAYPNLPILSIPVAAGLAYAPHFFRVILVFKTMKRWNNVSPRGQVDKLQQKMPKATYDMAKRAENAHQNGIETLGLYIGSVLAALYAGVDKSVVNHYSGLFIGARLVFNILYIINTNEALAACRTGVWSVSIYSCIRLLLAAAATKY